MMPTTAQPVDQIIHGDCIANMLALTAGCVDLAFADPPFNIGYEYDVYQDKKKREDYLAWSRQWIAAVHHALKDSGGFWLAIGDEYAAELKVASQEIGFHSRSWVIWYYTFGVNCKNKFSRSHAHLFYFVKDPETFTFRSDEPENRIPSARQLVYGDARANPKGRLPDDTWVLRPQDLADCFTPMEDTWYFPRVAGTFKERAGFHGCQMPEQLLGRIIRYCSHPGDLVMDPFSGSATTVAVAKKLGRRYLAFDLSEEYVTRGRNRLEAIQPGDPLDGAAEPTVSAPATANGIVRSERPTLAGKARVKKPAAEELDFVANRRTAAPTPPASSSDANLLSQDGLLDAYRRSYQGYSLDRLVADPDLNATFVKACQKLKLAGEPRDWNWSLFGMRKRGLLAEYPATERTEICWEDCDPYLFASEIAWRQMTEGNHHSLDTILCDLALAAEFDQLAGRWAPGYTPLEYRWAALKLRKNAKLARARAQLLDNVNLEKKIPLTKTELKNIPKTAGVYVVWDAEKKDLALYAGSAASLRERLTQPSAKETAPAWRGVAESLKVSWQVTEGSHGTRLALQHRLVESLRPQLNLLDDKVV